MSCFGSYKNFQPISFTLPGYDLARGEVGGFHLGLVGFILGLKILLSLIFLDLIFYLLKFMFLGSHVAYLLFIYLKSSKLYKVTHPTRGVLRLKEYMHTEFIYKKYQVIKEI